MTFCMGRREFITLLGGAAVAWPLVARAQQRATPVIGFLNSQSPDAIADRVRGFRQGLKDAGYVEGENVAIEYRWAEGQYDRLPELAADLVRRQVAVIVANGPAAAFAKAATTTIPIVFLVAEDPVRLGLVASLARPAGNATGINFFVGELVAKQLGLLRELVPRALRIAVLFNPKYAGSLSATADAESAAHAMGLQVRIFNASHSREVNDAFTTIARDRHEALLVGPDPYFVQRRTQLVTLAARHAIPTSYNVRDFVEAGGYLLTIDKPTAGRGCPHRLKKKRAQCSRSPRELRRALPFRGKVGCDRIRARKAEGPMTDWRVAAEHRFRPPSVPKYGPYP
jgi:putative ABC transport system substrate-binding protein